MTENKFELQSYFILYLHFVRILSLSKDIVSYLHISNFFVRVSLCRAKLWLVEYAFPQMEHRKAIV
jgi:hypothetical protein